jgi:hypothetical protein
MYKMELNESRPVIHSPDHPMTVYRSLLGSHVLWCREQSGAVADGWNKKAADARDTLQDGFGITSPGSQPLRPNGKAELHLCVDELEYALVGHGVGLIDDDPKEHADEIAAVDAVLKSIDKALKRKN